MPNVSEGRDQAVVDAIAAACARAGATLLSTSADPDHHRAVLALQAPAGALAEAVLAGAREAVARIDLRRHDGLHPRVGAVDVAPVVYLDRSRRGAAVAEALVLADLLASELDLPVFLYGELAGGRTRAQLRAGGPDGLQARLDAGELAPDYGPPRLHPAAGAVLVAARPPLLAFNVELAPPATLQTAKAIAAAIREGGTHGLPGVRALGLALPRQGIVQVSTNVEDALRVRAADVVAAVAAHSPVLGAELVAPVPRAALAGFPESVPLRGVVYLD